MARMTTGNPVGRPNTYSDEEIIQALEESKGLVFVAAKKIGCHPDTIRLRARTVKEVRQCIRQQRGELLDKAEQGMRKGVERGEFKFCAYILDRLGHKRGYKPTKETHIGGSKNAPPIKTESKGTISLKDLNLSIEARREIIKALKERAQNGQPPGSSGT